MYSTVLGRWNYWQTSKVGATSSWCQEQAVQATTCNRSCMHQLWSQTLCSETFERKYYLWMWVDVRVPLKRISLHAVKWGCFYSVRRPMQFSSWYESFCSWHGLLITVEWFLWALSYEMIEFWSWIINKSCKVQPTLSPVKMWDDQHQSCVAYPAQPHCESFKK